MKKSPAKAKSKAAKNLLKAVPNEKAYKKLSSTDKKGFDKAAKKAGLPTKKSPAKKPLVGKQKNLPEQLKKKILASPAQMKKSAMKMKKESMAMMKKSVAMLKKASAMKMKMKSAAKMMKKK